MPREGEARLLALRPAAWCEVSDYYRYCALHVSRSFNCPLHPG